MIYIMYDYTYNQNIIHIHNVKTENPCRTHIDILIYTLNPSHNEDYLSSIDFHNFECKKNKNLHEHRFK